MLIPISQLQFKKMPIINGMYPNHFDDSEDFEYFCGMEHYPYILMKKEVVETTSSFIPQRQSIPSKESIFRKFLKSLKF